MNGSGTLLAVFAHPDDESFGPGGCLASAAADGMDVHVVTLTDGAAGTAEGDLSGDALAAVRARELIDACHRLGVTSHQLTYRDSGFHDPIAAAHPDALVNADRQAVLDELGELIQTLRPDVVLTHDETGGYGHRDHVRCHELVIAAFDSAHPWQPQRLYCDVASDRWMKTASRVMRLLRRDPTRVGVNKDIDLTRIGVPADSITTRIDIRDQWAAKKAAAACHRSQGGGPPHTRHLPIWLLRLVFPTETFIRLAPVAPPELKERSFFGSHR